MFILELVLGQEGPDFLLLDDPSDLVPHKFQPIHFPQVLKLHIKIQTVVFQNLLLVVVFGLGLQRLRDGNDAIDIMPAYLEITLLEIFIAVVGPAFVVLESAFVLFFVVVVCEMNTG